MTKGVDDIRLSTDLPHHPKVHALEQRLGAAGVWCLIRLWCWAGRFATDGILRAVPSEIEVYAGWKGEPNAFLNALVDLRFLESPENVAPAPSPVRRSCTAEGGCATYELHNWRTRQGWAYYAEERAEACRDAARVRWKKRAQSVAESAVNAERNANRMRAAHAGRNAPSPSPSASPSRTDGDGGRRRTAAKQEPPPPPTFTDSAKASLLDAWKEAQRLSPENPGGYLWRHALATPCPCPKRCKSHLHHLYEFLWRTQALPEGIPQPF